MILQASATCLSPSLGYQLEVNFLHATSPTAAFHRVWVCDCSGSVGAQCRQQTDPKQPLVTDPEQWPYSRMVDALEEIYDSASLFAKNDWIITYNNRASLQKLHDFIEQPQNEPNGTTDFCSVLKCIMQFIEQEALDHSHVTFVFMTDGFDTSGNQQRLDDQVQACQQFFRRVHHERSIATQIHCIGFTDSADRAFLQRMQYLGTCAGVSRHVTESEELGNAFLQLFHLPTSLSLLCEVVVEDPSIGVFRTVTVEAHLVSDCVQPNCTTRSTVEPPTTTHTTTSTTHPCAVCKSASTHRCKSCRYVYYCSRVCQARDWKAHRLVCKSMAQTSFSPEADSLQPHQYKMTVHLSSDILGWLPELTNVERKRVELGEDESNVVDADTDTDTDTDDDFGELHLKCKKKFQSKPILTQVAFTELKVLQHLRLFVSDVGHPDAEPRSSSGALPLPPRQLMLVDPLPVSIPNLSVIQLLRLLGSCQPHTFTHCRDLMQRMHSLSELQALEDACGNAFMSSSKSERDEIDQLCETMQSYVLRCATLNTSTSMQR